jgi:4'-phosphopantetheinyl transferase
VERSAATLEQWLSDEEHDRASRFRFDADRRRFAHTRGLLRQLLGHYLGCSPSQVQFDVGPMGKLSVQSARVRFNVSHSHEWALIAIAQDRDVGVDVEHHRPLHHDLFAIATRFFAPSEVDALRALPPEDHEPAFYRIWSRKEAFIKATGQGISAGLDTFAVSIDDHRAVRLQVFAHPEEQARWMMRALDIGADYGAAVAVERLDATESDIELKLWEWEPPAQAPR